MKPLLSKRFEASERGSTLVIVLWIAIGLVTLTLYFGQSMLTEVRAADHRVEGLAAEQAIEGGIRYVTSVLANQLTNGIMPSPESYANNAVRLTSSGVGADQEASAMFWLIGRSTNSDGPSRTVSFGLVDEASKVNLNSARSNVLYYLSDWNVDLTEAILDWRSTNGPGTTISMYAMQNPSYECKQSSFETIDELRLVVGITPDILEGEDRNRNGILDPDETDLNQNGVVDSGLLDLVTVYSREPNTYSNGTPKINIRVLTPMSRDFIELLQQNIGSTRAGAIMRQLGLEGGGARTAPASFTSPLQLFRRGGFTQEEFDSISDMLTTVQGDYIEGRININTASPKVLSCLPGLTDSPDLVDLLVNYRLANPDRLNSVAWLVDALGQSNQETLSQLERQDILTTRSYQFSADIAAVGLYGRGYRRVRFVIDTVLGSPRVIYRQDLTSLGWALGKETREQLLPQNLKNGSIAAN